MRGSVVSAAEGLALAWGAGAALLALLQLRTARRWSRAPVAPWGPWRPKATVIVPCRGEQRGFVENVAALLDQDYPDYEVLFVVDSREDPAWRALERLDLRGRGRLVLTAPEVVGDDWATGKIVAILSGIAEARPGSEVLVLADADVRPSRQWLACLVAPLEDRTVGGATGFQAYHPETRARLGDLLRDAFVSHSMQAMFNDRVRFLWGGSTAIRRNDFERSSAREWWKRIVADDAGVTFAVRELGLGIAFAPGAIVGAAEDWRPGELLPWAARQMALAKAVATRFFWAGFAINLVTVGTAALGLGLALSQPSPLLGLAGLLMLAPTLASVPRALLRARLVRRAAPSAAARPAWEARVQALLAPLVPWLMLLGFLRAIRMRRFAWRGREYGLGS